MKILVAGARPTLARALEGAGHVVQTFAQDVRDPEVVKSALAGREAVVYFAPTGDEAAAADPLDVLDAATCGTFNLMAVAEEAGVRRIVLGSTLAFFKRHPAVWNVDSAWRPRPTPDLAELCPWLAELSVREAVRASRLHAVCLRFGQTVGEEETIRAVVDALAEPLPSGVERSWRVVHVGETSGRSDDQDGRPWRDVFAPTEPIASRPIKNIVLFGAGGPVAAVTVAELVRAGYILRLTDLRPLEDIARENNPQSPGAPVAGPLPAPHENRVVDVRNPESVRAACEGMDAIINCSVVRPDPVEAFRVNTLGAYNVVRAAVACGIRRVVHTGPQMLALHGRNDYSWDYDVPGDAPTRPGLHLYGHSKYLGQEICRVFAGHHGLEVPVLLFSQFVNPDIAGQGLYPMVVSWADTGRVILAALEVDTLPSPYEEIHVTTDVPHSRFSSRRAKDLLSWEARDGLDHLWRRQSEHA